MLPSHKHVRKMFYSKPLGKEVHEENHVRGILEKNEILASQTSLMIIPIYVKRGKDLNPSKQVFHHKNKTTFHLLTRAQISFVDILCMENAFFTPDSKYILLKTKAVLCGNVCYMFIRERLIIWD